MIKKLREWFEKRNIRFRFIRDNVWVGVYHDRKRELRYICYFPCCVIQVGIPMAQIWKFEYRRIRTFGASPSAQVEPELQTSFISGSSLEVAYAKLQSLERSRRRGGCRMEIVKMTLIPRNYKLIPTEEGE